MARVWRVPVVLSAVVAVVAFAADPPKTPARAPKELPRGIPAKIWELSVAPGQEPTPEKVALGEKLFNDKRLSSNDQVSCATCHDPKLGFTDRKPLSEGVKKGEFTQRNSPTVLNALFNSTQFWDGRSATLEDQAKLPILNPIEMGQPTPEAVVKKIGAIPEYAQAFQKIYGRPLSYDDLVNAIAAFERTQISANAPFDRFILGETKAMSASAQRGWSLFNGKARCNTCHQGNAVSPLFSDMKFHNIGVAARKQDFVALAREALQVVRTGDEKQIDELAIQSRLSELGRFLVTKNENEIGAFRTMGLRNILLTAPYMHDGSMATLWDVVDHYNKGGIPNPFLDGGMQRLGLTEPEIDDLVAFMAALTGDKHTAEGNRELARQRARKNRRPERDTAVAMGKKGHLGDLAPNPTLKDPAEIGSYGNPALVK